MNEKAMRNVSTRILKQRKLKRKTKRLPAGIPNPIDIHVGVRLRFRRTLLGLSQEKLGDAVGLTFQQIQKYERGANRIGASRLFQFSRILDVSIEFFFADMPEDMETVGAQVVFGLRDQGGPQLDPDTIKNRETLELVRAYYRISDSAARKRLYELIKAVARGSSFTKETLPRR